METLNNPDGLVNLDGFIKQLVGKQLSDDKTVPIVLVPGFSGWGSPLFGAINYWGGIECLPKVLMEKGYTVIVTPIAPLSSNWERACELYRMLTFGKFSTFMEKTGEIIDHYDVDVSYGKYFSDLEKAPDTPYATDRKRAIMFSRVKNEYEDWRWSEDSKIHLICHSQGGNTARYLISLLAGGSLLHPEYFSIPGRDKWIISMTTLGTPHRGTTVIDVLQNLIQDEKDQIRLLARGFAAIAYQDAEHRPYDLQLDHWGIRRFDNEPFEDMRRRFEGDSGPVAKWLRSKNNGFYDNSIEGVMLRLNRDAIQTSSHIFYFSLSFHATDPFPTAFPPWTLKAVHSFPLSILSPLLSAISSLPLINTLTALLARHLGPLVQKLEMALLTKLCAPEDLVKWTTASIATPFLQAAGFTNTTLPPPGKYMPRTDVIPPMIPTCYAMSGLDLTHAQAKILGGPPPGEDWNQNDGVVNTESMKGPDREVIREIRAFPLAKLAGGAGGMDEAGDAKGVYWHFGTNDKMDHADEIGVFVADDTSFGTRDMYLNLAALVSRLPASTPTPGLAPVANGVVNGDVRRVANGSMNGAATH